MVEYQLHGWVKMKIFQIIMLGFLTSCGVFPLPDEHIEVEFDMQSKHIPKPAAKESTDIVN